MAGSSSGASSEWSSRDGVVKCGHGVPEVRQLCRRGKNSGLYFYGCPHWKEKHLNCRFFIWEKDLIGHVELSLVDQNEMLHESIEKLTAEVGSLSKLKDENETLKKKVAKEKEKRLKAQEEVKRLRDELCKMKANSLHRFGMEVVGLIVLVVIVSFSLNWF